jgi:glucosamine-6-phosphate deaminase
MALKILQMSNYEEMSRKAANILSAQVTLFPESVLGLATGSTPLGIYRQLVRRYETGEVDFSGVRSVNLDEYCGLSAEDPNSYHCYMKENLFGRINIRPENTHIPDGTARDAERECRRYDGLIESLGGIDLQLLGLGVTGHIGFNEPNDFFDRRTHRVRLSERTIAANARLFRSADEVPRSAFTMGIGAIMRAKKVLLVVSGKHKAAVLKEALFGPVTPKVPASILQFHPDVTVAADEDALSESRSAGLLNEC